MKASKIPVLISIVVVSVFAGLLAAQDRPVHKPFRIAGYLPDYRFAGFEPSMAKGLTDLIVFSAELHADGTLNSSRIERCPWPRLQELRKSTGIRLWLAIGGWDRSEHFSAVAGSGELRKRCVESISKFAREHRLDGIDFDWEHPKNPAEERAYGQLMRDSKTAFETLGLKLSMTVAGWQNLDRTAIDAADAVQVMAYDHPGRHSTFESSRSDVEKLKNASVPASKITMGVPFYGRDIEARTAMTWNEIVSKYDPKPDVDEVGSMYFNGPETMKRKVAYAIESGLGGIMIWEIGQDADGEKALLKSIRDGAKSISSK